VEWLRRCTRSELPTIPTLRTWPALYSHVTRTLLALYSHCTQTLLTLYSHYIRTTVRTLRTWSTLYSHFWLALYSHCTNTIRTLYSHFTHTVFTLYSHFTLLACLTTDKHPVTHITHYSLYHSLNWQTSRFCLYPHFTRTALRIRTRVWGGFD